MGQTTGAASVLWVPIYKFPLPLVKAFFSLFFPLNPQGFFNEILFLIDLYLVYNTIEISGVQYSNSQL